VLRDILDSPSVTVDAWTRRGYYNILRWFYDRVLVLGDQSIFDVCEEYQFPQGLREKVHHCGYVQRPLPGRSRSAVRSELGIAEEESLVLVTAGGGEDGYELFSASLVATSSLAQRLPLKTLLVTGPELGTERTQAISRAAQSWDGLQVIEFTDDLMSYMNAADTVISMAGYNTICELLTLGKRSIVVPRVRPIEEQRIRAERLAGFRAFRTILPDELTPRILENAIEEELRLAQSTVPVPTCIDLGALPRITAILQREASSAVCDVESAAVREMLAPTGSEW
jgi:predicted glycosyltransferase